MGSYPLAALSVQPPPDPTQQIERGANLSNLLQMRPLQMQALQQQVQAGALENQQRQQQLKDQQVTSRALLNWNGKDPQDLISDVVKNGGSANAAMGLQQHFLTLRDTASQIAQRDAQTGQTNLKTVLDKHDSYLGAINAAENVPDDQLHDHLAQTINSLIPDNADPQSLQLKQGVLRTLQSGLAPAELRSQLDAQKAMLQGSKEQFEQAQSAAKTKEEAATTQKTQLETQIMQQYGTPQQQEAKYIALQTQKNMGAKLSPQDQAFSKAYEHYKTLVPVANFNLQNAGIAGTGGGPSAVAQMIASGQAKWSDFISPRSPMSVKNTLAQEVKAINPNFNTGDFAVEQAVRKQFTSGSAAQNLTAFNTAIDHAQQLNQAVDQLGNINERTLNKLGNAIGVELGSDKTTNFNVIKNALSGEISKVFKGGQATDAEISQVQGPFNSANSPQQLKGAIQNAIRLMNSKREALRSQYNAGVQGQPNFGQPTPETQNAAPAINYQPGLVRNGYRFKGGDPTKKENWEKQ